MDEVRLTADILAALSKPFEPEAVQWKPQATTKDKTRAMAVAFVEVRAYQDRLNEVLVGDWSDDYEIVKDGSVILCRLTVAGVTRADVGESDPDDQNVATSAIAQAFKRACVKFGLGAYLYRLPKTWADYDEQHRCFTSKAMTELNRVVTDAYKANGGSHPPAGEKLDADFPRFEDGTPVPENAMAYYRDYWQDKAKAPADVEALRAWVHDRTKTIKANGKK